MKKFNPSLKSNDHQIKQMLCAACRFPLTSTPSSLQELLSLLELNDRVNLPVETTKIFEIKDKIPVLVQAGQKNSPLVSMLTEQPDCAGLFIDSCIAGREGVFLAKYMNTTFEAGQWLSRMSQPECLIRHIERNEFVLAAPFLSFVTVK